jgi:prepilin-type processing-associated H-X9-DG protein
MGKRLKLTLVEAIVGIVILLFAFVLIILALNRLKKIASKVVCGTKLKGLGTAMIVYGNDYDDNYPELPGEGPWSKTLGFSYDNEPDFTAAQSNTSRTISASLYLLVREADVSPKSFICPQQPEEIEFDGANSKNLDIVELWDFGPDPYKHVSYAYHNPYGRYAPDGSAAFAVAADMSPWIKDGDFLDSNSNTDLPPQVIEVGNSSTFEKGNSLNHTEYEDDFFFFTIKRKHTCGFGQNIVFADGHAS